MNRLNNVTLWLAIAALILIIAFSFGIGREQNKISKYLNISKTQADDIDKKLNPRKILNDSEKFLEEFKEKLIKNNEIDLIKNGSDKQKEYVLSRHVLKSDEEIMDKMNNQKNLVSNQKNATGLSSFTNKQIAQEIIAKAMLENWDKIVSWMLESSKQRFAFDYNAKRVIGRGISREEFEVSNRESVRVVLERNQHKFSVLTAYPVQCKKD